MRNKSHILPIIVLAQFACTSLWFAGNAIVEDLTLQTGLGKEIVGYVISSVQFGFIIGTFCFAMFMIADRFSPSKVFFICSVMASVCNWSLAYDGITTSTLLLARFGTGFFLAGIYPVGMKIAADYYEHGLGKALGYLVGALVVGTGFPYLIGGLSINSSYILIIRVTSFLAILGGLGIWLFVPNGPFRKPSSSLQLKASFSLFNLPNFRKAAFGYFGHMWELYAFWAFTPLAIKAYNQIHHTNLSIPLWTFIIIAIGGVSCVLGGYLSLKKGSKKIALTALIISGICCLASPLFFYVPEAIFLLSFIVWGASVIADSPQFSTMVANAVPTKLKATGLTIVNSIGFGISIISIQLLSHLNKTIAITSLLVILGIGPIMGLIQFLVKKKEPSD